MKTDFHMIKEDYDLLYKKYLRRSPRVLLEYAGLKREDSIWDLCCGSNGRVVEEAMLMGAAYVTAVDLNEHVNNLCVKWDIRDKWAGFFSTYRLSVHDFLKLENLTTPDVVVCQQAINYWFNAEDIELLSDKMPSGSVFVFNTFNMKPLMLPRVVQYVIDGRDYVEVAWSVDNTVHHVQIVTGLSPHTTSFRWIPRSEFESVLGKFFRVDVINPNCDKTDIYICKKI